MWGALWDVGRDVGGYRVLCGMWGALWDIGCHVRCGVPYVDASIGSIHCYWQAQKIMLGAV